MILNFIKDNMNPKLVIEKYTELSKFYELSKKDKKIKARLEKKVLKIKRSFERKGKTNNPHYQKIIKAISYNL